MKPFQSEHNLFRLLIQSLLPSRCFKHVLNAVISDEFHSAYMSQPGANELPARVRRDPTLYPFFKNAIGAVDGSHLFVSLPSHTRACWRDWDGHLTQNMMAICNFDMFFTFVLVGWEGSAADGPLYHRCFDHGLKVPEGKYFLADAGFGACDTLLTPYRKTRYHLCEWLAG